jgi:transglutaminase/protease-like cytokinesis protein 3
MKRPQFIEKILDYLYSDEFSKFLKQYTRFLLLVAVITMICGLYNGLQYTGGLNEYFAQEYARVIQPEGDRELSQIVSEASLVPNLTERLEYIADWEVQNFTEIYWERAKGRDVQLKSLNFPINTYIYTDSGKIRAMDTLFAHNPYNNDPRWITYYRFGACGELAYLFVNVTNRTGIPTRVIIAELTTNYFGLFDIVTGNHAWVEVRIGDSWYFFDPDAYGQYRVLGNENFNGRWFGRPENYDIFSADQVSRVIDPATGVDVVERYPKLRKEIDMSKFW